MWLRLPTNHALSFLWTCYLSFLRGDAIEDEEELREYRDLEAWLSLSTNDLLNQDAESIDRFFETIDLDKNGKIKLSELRSAMESTISVVDIPDEDDGDVERAEIRKSIMTSLIISTLGTKLNKDAKRLIRSADHDGDGTVMIFSLTIIHTQIHTHTTGEIDIKELRDLIRRAKELKPMPLHQAKKWLEFSRRVLKNNNSDKDSEDEVDRLFSVIDIDGDGKIDAEEFRRALETLTVNNAKFVFSGPDVDDIGGDMERAVLRRVFLLRLLNSMKQAGINDMDSLLEVADLDQDGSIDREEMRRVMQKARSAIKRSNMEKSTLTAK